MCDAFWKNSGLLMGVGGRVRCTRPHSARGMLIPLCLRLCVVCVAIFVMRTRARVKVFKHTHIHTHPTGKGRVLRGGFSSTAHTGPGTSSGEEFGKKWATIFQGIGAVLGVAGATAVVVRTFDQTEMATEIKYIESKAAAEIAQAKADVARVEDKAAAEIKRVEDKRTMSEVFWKAEVERFKREVQLAYTQDYEPYQAALVDKRKKRGGTGGLEEKEEEKDLDSGPYLNINRNHVERHIQRHEQWTGLCSRDGQEGDRTHTRQT